MFAGRFVSQPKVRKKTVPALYDTALYSSIRELVRQFVRIFNPHKIYIIKLVLFVILSFTAGHLVLVTVVRPLAPVRNRSVGIVNRVHDFLHNATQWNPRVAADPNRRHPQKVAWNNTVLSFHKLTYMNSSSQPIQSTDLRHVKVPKLGDFGQVVIAYDKAHNLTLSPAALSDTIYIPPADYLCLHGSSPLDASTRLVLATTIFFSNATAYLTHNTLRNWARLRPFIQPVLYVTPTPSQPQGPGSVRLACSLGWDVFIAPESNSNNFPVLRAMMQDVKQKYQAAPMLGYANGDILFDASLPQTLEFFLQHHRSFVTKDYQLIVGIRIDTPLAAGRALDRPEDVATAAREEGVPHDTKGFDYFISTRDGFPWSSIPPFIIGKPVYDNWLVWWSLQRRGPVTCLDASAAITALHQQPQARPRHKSNTDKHYNANLVPKFPVSHGNTRCIARKLVRREDGVLEVKQARIRPLGPGDCTDYVHQAPVVFAAPIPGA